MNILLAACISVVPMNDVDVALWMDNGDHIFIIDGVEHNVGGECLNIEEENEGTHKYTWSDRSGTVVVCRTKRIFMEVDGEFILVEEE